MRQHHLSRSVESVKTLVDEFSQFARFPAAQPVRSDLNEVVESALAVFHGRLDGIDIRVQLAPDLPPVQHRSRSVPARGGEPGGQRRRGHAGFAGQALAHQPRSRRGAETVELVIADTGCGVSAEEKEKLFLPYFSTKGRGTGLGLAIVNHILADHGAQIRVEDNQPAGARFTIEIPALPEPKAASRRRSRRAVVA